MGRFLEFCRKQRFLRKRVNRKEMASKCCYTQYVKEHYTLEELEEMYQDTFKT